MNLLILVANSVPASALARLFAGGEAANLIPASRDVEPPSKADIYRVCAESRDVVYTRWFRRWIMAVIEAIPEPQFKCLSL